MAYILQSQLDNTLYFNGTILDRRNHNLALFSEIDNAVQYTTEIDAEKITDIINVPVNIVEV